MAKGFFKKPSWKLRVSHDISNCIDICGGSDVVDSFEPHILIAKPRR